MQSDIFKITMRNGLYMGLLFSVNFLFSASRITALMLLTYVVIAFIIWASYKLSIQFRDQHNDGYINYWKVVSFVVLTFFFGGIISGLFKMIYTSYINPEFLPQLFEEGVRQMEQNRSLLESLNLNMDEEYYEELERQFRPAPYSFQTLWVNILSGTVLGLIIAGIVQKKRGLFDEEPGNSSIN